jgi:hypothetical protein
MTVQIWVCTHYKAKPGYQFKEYYIKGCRVPVWRQVSIETMERRGWKPVRCNECFNPAVQLDHHHPWMTDYTLCESHLSGNHAQECGNITQESENA